MVQVKYVKSLKILFIHSAREWKIKTNKKTKKKKHKEKNITLKMYFHLS